MEVVYVVQYVNRETSDKLLDKYADISIYGFDYLQSATWSPLRPIYNVYADATTSKKKHHRHQHVNRSHKLLGHIFKKSRPPSNSSISSASPHTVLD